MKKIVKTKDGSMTVFNSELKEHYHSISGALEEAKEKYINPLEINDGMRILDFCFGLGYNSFAAISSHSNIEITALENDIEIVKMIECFNFPEELSSTTKHFLHLHKLKKLTDDRNNTIILLLEDAKKTIYLLDDNYFDRIFFDPFSPQKMPNLWTTDVFVELFRSLKRGGKLSTYSCAKQIRKNLATAGFVVTDGPSIGRKSPSTIAIKE